MLFRNRALARVGAVSALTIGAVALAGAPAFADPADADLSVKAASSKISVGVDGKALRFDINNGGPAIATDTVVTLDLAGLDSSMVGVDPAQFEDSGCEVNKSLVTCEIGAGNPGETLPWLFSVERLGGEGPAGSFTLTAESSAPDPDPKNNTVTVPVEVVGGGVDLLAIAWDVYTISEEEELTPVAPGDAAPLFWGIFNQGDHIAQGVNYSITLPEHVTFVDDFKDCTTSADRRVLDCEKTGAVIVPGLGLETEEDVYWVQVSEDAPGPVTLTGGELTASAIDSIDPSKARMAATSVAPEGMRVVTKEEILDGPNEVDEGDNDSSFAVFVGGPAAAGGGGGGGGGGLPVTGVQAGLLGGVGLAVVVAGGALFMLGRRRRVVLVTPGDEKSTV